jgi:hypothetical protein
MDDGVAAPLGGRRSAARDRGAEPRRRDALIASVLLACGALVALAACRNSSNDGVGDGGPMGPDADVAPLSQGVAVGVFGMPSPDNGIQDPAFLVGCPTNGLAAVDVVYIQPQDEGALDQGTFVAVFTRTGGHDHIAIGSNGSDLTCDFDETGPGSGSGSGSGSDAGTGSAAPPEPFVYGATVVTDPAFLDIAMHSFSAHMLNPAAPALDTLGTWNSDTLVTCP